MDRIDKTILHEMNFNCRASYESLARKTGLSPNAIKNRVAKLIEGGVILEFSVFLTTRMLDADETLAIVLTNGTERVGEFVSRIGKNPMVYHVSALACVKGGAYFVLGQCPGPVMQAELGAFLRGLYEVQDIELHPLAAHEYSGRQGRKVEFSKLQLRVLRCLNQDARMQISKIAQMTGMAPKTVRRALREIMDSGGVHFSYRGNLAAGGLVDALVRINWNDKMISADKLVQWLREEYPVEFWWPWVSASDSIVFADFVVGNLLDVERISDSIRKAPFVKSSSMMVAFTNVKFPRLGETGLQKMLNDAGA